MSDYIANPQITGANLKSMDANSVRELWARGVEIFEQATDFFRQFEGSGASFPIQSKTDTSKGDGEKITFSTMAGLYGRAHMGEETFDTSAHFESVRIASNSLSVEWFRHGVRYTEPAEEQMGMRGQLMAGVPAQLGNWLGRLKTKHMMMSLLHLGAANNQRVINGRASINAIKATDTLTYDSIITLGSQLQTRNGRPAYVGKDAGGNPIYKYVVVASSDALTALDLDPDYKTAVMKSGIRGPENLIFKGGFHNLRGHVLKEYTAIDHDGAGPIGSPINPKAELGVAITAGTGGFDLKGGGNAANAALTRVDYFEDFPNFDFRFSTSNSVGVGSAEYYVVVYNISGPNLGKWGFYKFTTNDGMALTVTQRLGSSAGGARATQVGDVYWDATVNTDEHPEGSIVFLASASAVPIGYSIMMGSAAARRGYGKYQRQRREQSHEGGFVKDIYIMSVFGQGPRKDVRGRAPGYMVLAHGIAYPGYDIDPKLTP